MEFFYFLAAILSIFLFILSVRAMLAMLDVRKRLKEDSFYRSYWIEKRMGNNEKACEQLIRMYCSEEFSYMISKRVFPKKRKLFYRAHFTELGYPEKYDELTSN